MRLHKLMILGAVLGLGAMASACDGSDDNQGSGNPTLNTGLESKTLSSLSQSEIDQLNQAIGDYMAASVSKADACKMAGFAAAGMAGLMGQGATDASIQKLCSDTVAACNSSTSTPESSTGTKVTSADLANCQATVTQFESCMKDTAVATNAAIKSIPNCSAITISSISSSNNSSVTTTESPASCQALQSNCPELVAGTSGSTSP